MGSERPKIAVRDLKLEVVVEAAEEIRKIADDAVCWKPPEYWPTAVDLIVRELNRIAEAICLTTLHDKK